MRCPECGGRVVKEKVTLTLLGEVTPVFFRNVPAEICEQCGIGFPSDSVAEQIVKVLDDEATPRGFLSSSVVEWEVVVLLTGSSSPKAPVKSN